MLRKILLFIAILMPILVAGGASAQGQTDVLSDELCQKAPSNPTCVGKVTSEDPISGPNGFITRITNIISILVGIGAVVGIITGGLKLITSGSNPQEVTKGREMILYSMVAIFIVVIAQAIVRFFLGKVFGP